MEVIVMRHQSGNKTATGTDIQQVKQQNKQFAAGKGMGSKQFGSEFGSETNVEEVKKLNQQSEQNKNKNKNMNNYSK
jgi:small acid-soluble spore protein E (minor gamma-type SASP)